MTSIISERSAAATWIPRRCRKSTPSTRSNLLNIGLSGGQQVKLEDFGPFAQQGATA